jgi:hypothetical protein
VPAVGSYGGAGVGVLRGTSTSGGAGTSRLEGTVSRGMVYNVLGKLMGGASQLAEFQAVLSKLQYDTHQELSYEQVSEGLKHMGGWGRCRTRHHTCLHARTLPYLPDACSMSRCQIYCNTA